MKKYSLSGLAIEVTRRCNLNCGHCLRGESVQKDLNLRKFHDFLNGIVWIDSIHLTGGEPFASINTLNGIINILEYKKVGFGGFSIVTNCSLINDEAIKTLKKMFMLSKHDNSYIHVSKDSYHGWDENRENNLSRLKSEFSDVYVDENKHPKILRMGKAVEFGDVEPDRFEYKFGLLKQEPSVEDTSDHCIMGDLFISCMGSVHRDWEMSYDEMNNGFGLIMKIENGHVIKKLLKALDPTPINPD